MTHWIIRAIEPRDEAEWRTLFAGYREFYEYDPDDAVLDLVWSWLTDAAHPVRALAAEHPSDGTLVGMAHFRSFPRPSSGATGVFLDDLFTAPAARGHGAGRALLERVGSIARDEGATKVRWITAPTNTRARALYDSVASSDWVIYDMTT